MRKLRKAAVCAAVHCTMGNKSKELKKICEHLKFFIDLLGVVVANTTSKN